MMNEQYFMDCVQFFFEDIISPQINEWKKSNICISADYSRLLYGGYIRIGFVGSNEERLFIDININTGISTIPRYENEYRDDYFLLGNKKIKCKRYTICCENKERAQYLLDMFNTQYQTQFQLEQEGNMMLNELQEMNFKQSMQLD